MGRLIDVTGQVFGRLTATRVSHRIKKPRCTIIFWECKCQCGNIVSVTSDHLRSGYTQSCGCLWEERFRAGAAAYAKNRPPGPPTPPERYIWESMKQRCHNPKNQAFHDYGARGIYVCERWRHSFYSFYHDVGPRPTPQHTLERKDNDGSYSPENCIWATRLEQGRNTRANRRITHQGVTFCLVEWSEILNMNLGTLHGRLKRWNNDVERAFTEPIHPNHGRFNLGYVLPKGT